jgi:hypothetical protein
MSHDFWIYESLARSIKEGDHLSKRVVTSIRIDEEVLRKAKEIGLNISKIAENALMDLIELIEGES